MKSKICAVALSFIMLAVLVCGCGSKDNSANSGVFASDVISKADTSVSVSVSEPEVVSKEESEVKPEEKTEEEPVKAVEKDYKEVLNRLYEYLADFDSNSDYSDETVGIWENVFYGAFDKNVLDEIGYALIDLNDDGTKELVIMNKALDDDYGREVLALYTYVDDKPTFVTSGYSRNALYLLESGNLYNTGSYGASHSTATTMSLDNGSLKTINHCFTDAAEADNYEMKFYTNSTGSSDVNDENTVEVAEAMFTDFTYLCESAIVYQKITTFRNYIYSGTVDYSSYEGKATVTVFWADDTMPATPDYEEEGAVSSGAVMFATDKAVKDFTILGINTIIDDDGNISYESTVLSILGRMTPERDFAVVYAFPGDMPTSGFAYKDMNGDYHRFVIDVSGMDGSLIVDEF